MTESLVSSRSRSAWIGEALVSLHARRVVHERDAMARPLLDAVRWISAATVVFGHAIGLIFTRATAGPSHFGLFDMLSDLRGPAVAFFFVISGYLVGGGVLARSSRFRLRSYAIARFSRIYIVLVPAILLMCLLDGTAHLTDPASPVYAGIWPSRVLGSEPIDARYAPINWAVTVLSLESVVAPPAGSANALWSLGYEWVFYFVFPLIVVPLARFESLLLPLLPIGILMAVLVLLGRPFDAAYFGIWVLGAYARVMTDHANVPRLVARAGLLLSAVALIAGQFALPTSCVLLVGVGFACYLARFERGERGISEQRDRALADISYSLYVTHFPVLIFLTFIANRVGLLPVSGLAPGPLPLALLLAYLVAAFATAWLFGWLFERRTDLLRAYLSRSPGRAA